MKVLGCSLFCLLFAVNEARVFDLCELFYYLRSLGLDNYKNIGVKHYVCMALFPSKMNTRYYEKVNGHPYYGIFHLKGTEWCANGKDKSDDKCEMDCNKFLDDDIRDDVDCVKQVIISKAGIKSWRHYKDNCNINVLSYIFIRCTFFFTRDEWYHKIMRLRLPETMHIQVDK